MIDSKRIIYIPSYIKIIAILILAIVFGVSFWTALYFVGVPGHTDWILIALSVGQMAATVLIVTLVLAFGERDAGLRQLEKMTIHFLKHQVCKILSKMESPENRTNPNVKCTRLGYIYGANYEVEFENLSAPLKLWIGLNINRAQVIYFIPLKKTENDLKEIFKFTFSGAESIGYDVHYEATKIQNEEILSIWSTLNLKEKMNLQETNVLSEPDLKLFLIQDIAMMSQSLINTAYREGIQLHTDADPSPL